MSDKLVTSNHDSFQESNDLPIRLCECCGCILEFRYTEYIPALRCSLLGYCCVNSFCAEFGRVFEPSWSDTLILSQLGFALRKFGGKRN